MPTGPQIVWDDTVLPFQLDRPAVRGRLARIDATLDQVLAQHGYPPVIEHLVAEAVLLTALIGQTIKLRWKLSLQIRGRGAARLIATDYYAPSEEGAPARIRAYASYDPERLKADAPAFPQIGDGFFAILLDQGPGSTPYQGITPIAGGSLGACAEAYFAQSEQLPTRFACAWGRGAAGGWRAGGIMVQMMPRLGGFVATADGAADPVSLTAADLVQGETEEDWRRVTLLLETASVDELSGSEVQPPELLVRLFHEEGPRVFPAQSVRFGCSCSEAKVRQSLSIYSARDIAHMTTPEGIVTADCQFCGAHYRLDPATVGFEAARLPEAGGAGPTGIGDGGDGRR
jgi:molecular chaperone Hsp33